MSGLVVVDAPTLLDGADQLLHQAYVEWWLTQPASRYLAELLHQTTVADVVLTADGAHWLGEPPRHTPLEVVSTDERVIPPGNPDSHEWLGMDR